MSIMTDARLRLLEARVAEIERRLAEGGTAGVPTLESKPEPKPKSKPRRAGGPKTAARAKKTSKQTRKAR